MATIDIILKKDIIGLGEEGDIKKVKAGYARNFLLPKCFAVRKNKASVMILEREKAQIEARKEEKRKSSLGLIDQLKEVIINFKATVAESDKLYGSITAQNIADELLAKGIELDKRKIELDSPIKVLGEYLVRIKLYEGISTEIKVIVESE